MDILEKEFGNQSIAILKAFGLLFTGHITQLAGPVGVANQTAQMLTSAPTFFLYVAGLSANLFVLNLIPIPPLDGYKFFENAVEACIKKKSHKSKNLNVHNWRISLCCSIHCDYNQRFSCRLNKL